MSSRTKLFKNTFFHCYINEWKNLNAEVRSPKSIHIFKKMTVTEKKENSPFSLYDRSGVKLFTGLRPQFSNLNEHI